MRLYTEALSADPQNCILYSNRSAAYLRLGQYSTALDDAIKARLINPKWPKVRGVTPVTPAVGWTVVACLCCSPLPHRCYFLVRLIVNAHGRRARLAAGPSGGRRVGQEVVSRR